MTDYSHIARRVAAASGKIAAADVADLRRGIYADGVVSRAEAAAMFEIERCRTDHDRGWSDLFVEALSDFALNREPPAGYVSADTARFVMDEIGKRKTPSTDAEVALLTNIIEKAREVPPELSAFALRHVKNTVMYGGGPDAMGREHGGGKITDADVAVLQRILWGAGSEGLLAISREEAEAMIAIADFTTGADNDPKFDDLFAKALGNYLLGATGRQVPAREVSLRWETEPAHRRDVVGVLAAALRSVPRDARTLIDTVRDADTLLGDIDMAFLEQNHIREMAIETASIMTSEKAGWLLDRIGQNGVLSEPEKALLRFVKREACAIDPSLQPMLDKAG